MTNEIVAKNDENQQLFTVSDDLMAKMSQDAETYKDETDVADLTIPRLKLVQSATPQVKKADPSYIKGLEEGDLLDTLTNNFIKGDVGAYIVPVKRKVVFLEWGDIQAGGGLKNNFGEDPTIYNQTPKNAEGKRIREIDGVKTEIIKTYDTYAYLISPDFKEVKEIVLSLSRSQEKSMRDFNSLIRMLQDPKTGKQLPEYAGVYKVVTAPVKNDKGSWFVYKFSAAGYTLSIPGIGERVYNEAKRFYQTITEGKTKVQEYENEKNKAGEGEFIDKLEEKI